jgi:hypothetical protein
MNHGSCGRGDLSPPGYMGTGGLEHWPALAPLREAAIVGG